MEEKVKRPFLKETDKNRIWKISHKRKYNPTTKERQPYGKTILATIWHDKPYKITFSKLDYNISNKKVIPLGIPNRSSWVFSLKNGKLNLYAISRQNGVSLIKGKSNNPNLIDDLGLTKLSEIKRVARILNIFFQENGYKKRLKLKDLTLENFRSLMIKIIYPGVRAFDFEIKKLNSAYSSFLREDIGLKKILKKCFGASGKKITNGFLENIKQNKNLDILAKARTWRGLVPLDSLHKLLMIRKYNVYDSNVPNNISNDWKTTRQFINQFSAERRIALFNEAYSGQIPVYIFTDTLNTYKTIKNEITIPPEIAKQGWQKLHDWITLESIKLRDKPREIIYKEKWAKIDGVVIGDFVIILPKVTTDLITLGQKLNMCVGGVSYQNFAVENRGLILEIRKENEPIYCMSVQNGQIDQFRAKYNENPSEEDWKIIVDGLVKANILGKIETYPIVMIPEQQPVYLQPNAHLRANMRELADIPF